MKNIHLIPTDKPSRLYYNNNDLELQFCELCKETTSLKENRNIYITSAEEITDGDWGLSKLNEVILFGINYNKNLYKKIILTTDKELIEDDVQGIDDEFLQWYVKNPSCEEVDYCNWNEYYKITPKEEQKQHLIEMMKADEELGLYEENTKCYCGHTTYCDCGPEEPKQETFEDYLQRLKERRTEDDYKYTDEDFEKYKEYISDCCKNGMSVYKCLEFMYFAEKDIDNQLFNREHKQETLEEASSKVAHMLGTKDSFEYVKMSFELGAKWQKERSYSEEEVLAMLSEVRKGSMVTSSTNNRTYWDFDIKSEKKWFEQFKKK